MRLSEVDQLNVENQGGVGWDDLRAHRFVKLTPTQVRANNFDQIKLTPAAPLAP